MLVYGRNVLLMTNPKEIKKVYISETIKEEKILSFLKENHIHYVKTQNHILDKMVGKNHQGIIIEREEYQYAALEELFTSPFLILLDHLEDPHNFGAIIRTAESCGVGGIIIPKDRSVSITDTVVKTSAGTVNKVPIAKVTNLVDTIKKLQKEGYFIYGADMNGKDLREVSFAPKKVLVIGNEGKGISNLVEKNCDEIVSIPMIGEVNSLNASVAAGILMYKMGGLS